MDLVREHAHELVNCLQPGDWINVRRLEDGLYTHYDGKHRYSEERQRAVRTLSRTQLIGDGVQVVRVLGSALVLYSWAHSVERSMLRPEDWLEVLRVHVVEPRRAC